jgi:hypothetical protein
MPKPPSYQIIYNWDGAPHGYSEHPQSVDEFVKKVYAPMADTQVGAHFWCIGSHEATWKSDALEMIGHANDRRYGSVGGFTHTENILEMLERGEDPHEAVVRRGRELRLHVYASVRMNDNHFSGAQPADMASMKAGELTRLRREHPEWLLGDQTSEWFALSWNMAVPEVREHRFAYVKEVCSLYDWDGVELDWQRHGFHLPDDYGYRLRYALTDLQRAVRAMTNELADSRGRPFYLAARVAGGLEMCRRIGYDVETWVKEGLVDILIPAGGASTDPAVDVEALKEICEGTDVLVYPGLDAMIPDAAPGPEDHFTKDQMLNRGVAARHLRAGADGIYIFNWHADRTARRDLLTQIGSAETLRRTDKIFAATHRVLVDEGAWRGAYRIDRLWGDVPVALKRTITGDGPSVLIQIGDDVATGAVSSIELRLRLAGWVRGDEVRVTWDGNERGKMAARYDNQLHDGYANPFAAPISDVSEAVWMSCPITTDESAAGDHSVKVVLLERSPRMESDLILTDVEVVVRYD